MKAVPFKKKSIKQKQSRSKSKYKENMCYILGAFGIVLYYCFSPSTTKKNRLKCAIQNVVLENALPFYYFTPCLICSIFLAFPQTICSYKDPLQVICPNPFNRKITHLIRNPGKDPESRTLPTAEDVRSIMTTEDYDTPPYNTTSANSFRNKLEGSRLCFLTSPLLYVFQLQYKQYHFLE